VTERTTTDVFGRRLRDLRVSVTDRCNLRCSYCMPADRDYDFLSSEELLGFREIARLVGIFSGLGVEKIRITGGEPLLRPDLDGLVARLDRIGGIGDLAMTTNGYLLARHARELRDAGLDRVTVSLDALDHQTHREMSGRDFGLREALEGIDAARDAGLDPVKVNMVVRRGVNDDRVLEMAGRFRNTGVVVRFIEYMDVGTLNDWRMEDVVPSREIVERIHQEMPLTPVEERYPGEVADRYRYLDGSGEIGFVSSVSQPFCRTCTRARLSADGKLYTCLFATEGRDLRGMLRDGADDARIRSQIREIWTHRRDRYSERRTARTEGLDRPVRVLPQHEGTVGAAGGEGDRVEMFRMGG